jgi:PAS domain S-box-containing protein
MKNSELIYPALKTAIVFFIFGFVWILVSDEVVHQIAPNYHIEQRLQTYKGWFFITGTALLIYYIVRGQLKKVIDYKNKLLISERSLSVVLENIGEGVISTSKLGAITSINKVAEHLIGMKLRETTGQSFLDVLRFYDHEGNDITARLLNKPGRLMDITKAAVLKANKVPGEIQVLVNSDRIYDNTGRHMGNIIAFNDVTERKLSMEALRESEDRLSKIMIATIDGMWDWNLKTDVVYYDPRYFKMAGYEPNEFDHTLDEFRKRVHPEDINRVMKHARLHLEGEVDQFIEEFRFLKKNGEWLWVLGRGVIVEWDEQGKPTRFLGTHTSITERKLAEEALLESEERFRTFMENSTDASSLYDAQLNLVEINKVGLAMFPTGTKKEDIIGKNLADIDPEIKKTDRYLNYLNVIETGEPLILDDFIAGPGWGDLYLSVRLFKVGNGLGMIVTDVTKQKQAEKAVKESEERYKKIVETTHDLIWSCDTEGNIWNINEASKQIYGYAPEEMIGENFAKFLPETQLKSHQKKFGKMVKERIRNIEFDTEIRNRHGKTIYLKDNVTVLNDENGNIKGILGASKNVTEKMLAERALRESMDRLELALDGGGLGLWDYNYRTRELIVSEQWTQMLGLEHNDKIPYDSFKKLIHPEDINAVHDRFSDCLENHENEFNMEFRMKHADEKWRWISSRGKIMEKDQQGKAERLVGTNLDITTTKHLELELQRQVKIYSSFIRYSSEGIYLFELEKPMPLDLTIEEQIRHFYNYGYVATCNDAFAKMYGYHKSEELVGMKQSQLHGGENVPENIDIMRQFIQSGYRIMQALSKEVDKEGNEIYISNNVVGIIEEGRLVRTWGSQYDITDRIKAQLELEESEKKYRLLFQTNPVPMVIVGAKEFNFFDVNIAVEKLLGYTREEFFEMKLWEIRPELSIFTLDELKARLHTIAGIPHETKLLTKNGETLMAEVIFDLIIYEGESATLAAINDITALKEAEKMVLRSLIEGEENERKRVATEIHDSLGQNLTAASLNFDSLKTSIQTLSKKDSTKFDTGLEFLKLAIEESRNIAHNLMPKAIDDFGLIPSLTSLFNQIEKSTGINVKFYENLGEGRLNRQIELNLYRITQEAINNLIKHSGATKVDIQLVLHKQEIIYTFEDNGIGFDKSRIEIAGKGMGLKSIFNRVIAMSGSIDLDTTPNRGTSITIEIPV